MSIYISNNFGRLEIPNQSKGRTPWIDIVDQGKKNQVLLSGIRIILGDGRKGRFWYDQWLQQGILKSLFPRLFMVSD